MTERDGHLSALIMYDKIGLNIQKGEVIAIFEKFSQDNGKGTFSHQPYKSVFIPHFTFLNDPWSVSVSYDNNKADEVLLYHLDNGEIILKKTLKREPELVRERSGQQNK